MKTTDMITPLYFAAQAGNMETVTILTGAGAEVDAKTAHGGTPLQMPLSVETSKLPKA